jgi:(S)-2-hydroxyglutarate dehydrogenase
MRSVAIIGGGIVGLATARALLQAAPCLELHLLEKEASLAQHQSTHNSGVLHAGLHYAPGSRRARLARAGIRAMTAFCAEHGIAHEICGKLVVAADATELPRLRALQERGQQNGLTGLRWLTPEEAREIEPHVRGVAALHVPEEGIVDYAAVCRAYAQQVSAAGAALHTNAEVLRLQSHDGGWRITTRSRELTADYIVNCAGLFADRVAELAGELPPCRIVPFRGEYYKLRPERQSLVRNLIYPTPDPTFPFLGVHFTRLVRGGIEAGPNAVLALAREGYRNSTVDLGDVGEMLLYPGIWRFLARHPRTVTTELMRSFSKTHFVSALQRLVPALSADDLTTGGSGVRAQAMLPTGEIIHDFLWIERPNALHMLSAPSPAATASLVIGQELAGVVLRSPASSQAPPRS